LERGKKERDQRSWWETAKLSFRCYCQSIEVETQQQTLGAKISLFDLFLDAQHGTEAPSHDAAIQHLVKLLRQQKQKPEIYLLFMMLLLGIKGPSSGCYPNNLKEGINSKANDSSFTSPKETLKRERGGCR
jgi:hypothetical protein